MNLSNAIAQMITDMLSEKDEVEFQRNILAQDLGCVPSQINYVLSSRFTPERGFLVESRRGGGGCIRIVRVSYDKDTLLMKVVNSVGDEMSENSVKSHLANLLHHGLLNEAQAALILAATSESNFRVLPSPFEDIVRAAIFKKMLLTVAKN
ncbi:MAG: CtsR family transcriptional regulator [Clostridia bacterium]|nr:CtsR family transcriptional regulator [Clostridia bacterium]